jgi:hypothetical protein
MKKAKSTEKHIKKVYTNKLQVTTSSNLDKRVLANSMSTLEKVKSVNSANIQWNIWVILAKSRITQVAAVLIVLSAICLLTLSDKGEPEQHKTTGSEIAAISETPAELVSAITLNMAFRDGGMQAMEKQFEKAEKKVKPGLKTRLTVDQLICELDGC